MNHHIIGFQKLMCMRFILVLYQKLIDAKTVTGSEACQKNTAFAESSPLRKQ